ncbi:protein of unknown function [Burkholderia multivorans]
MQILQLFIKQSFTPSRMAGWVRYSSLSSSPATGIRLTFVMKPPYGHLIAGCAIAVATIAASVIASLSSFPR